MASSIHYDYCLCCGSTAISKVFECKDYTVSQQTFEIWKCNTCTFMFTQNVPGEDYIGPYYNSAAYVSHSNTKEGFINRLYHLVRSFTLKTKRDLIADVTGLEHGVLLDIGAGTGAFAYTMQKAGWSVTGLEPEESARVNARKVYNVQLQELSKLQSLQSQTFDVVTLWHVLEHVHDLHGYLEKFTEILKPGGRLLIAVPNYGSYDAKAYGKYWAAWDVPRHLYHFSPKSMDVLVDRKGFVVQDMKPMWFDSFYVSMLSEKYKSGSENFLRAMLIGLVSNAKAFFNTKRCSSIIYIVRKK